MDRKKELIKVKGLQVAPAELENLIRSMAGVLDVAVIGIEDELRKESDDFKLDSYEFPMSVQEKFLVHRLSDKMRNLKQQLLR